MNTLKYIAAMRSEGLQKDAIGVRLQETVIGDIETLAALQGTAIAQTSAAGSTLQPYKDAPDVLDSTPSALMALEAITTLQRRFETLEAAVKEDKQSLRD